MDASPRLDLNDGRTIPQLGLGVWQMLNEVAARAVAAALEVGYRHVDTASIYANEIGVGEGLRASGLRREAVFVTTKIWNDDQGDDRTRAALEASLDRLQLDYVDLILLHWPSTASDRSLEAWRALIQARDDGRARSIGVSNFEPAHLDRLIEETGVTPALNQIELHPRFQQQRLVQANAARGIVTESWSPLGMGRLMGDPVIGRIANRHGRTPAQVIIRWHVDRGFVVIPKSATPSRIAENFDVFGFALDAEDMAAISSRDDPQGRMGAAVEQVTF